MHIDPYDLDHATSVYHGILHPGRAGLWVEFTDQYDRGNFIRWLKGSCPGWAFRLHENGTTWSVCIQ